MKKFIALLLIGLAFVSTHSQAAVTPIALSVFQPVQFPPDDFSITGARISLLSGRHRNVFGVDVGVLSSITDQRFIGVGLAGGANITHGNTTILGLQLAGLGNYNTNKTNVYGLQAALGANINTAESKIYGVQFALANIAKHTEVNGVQLGLWNQAETIRGLQIGVVNTATNLKGIQIGLLNFHQRGKVSVSPVINVGF